MTARIQPGSVHGRFQPLHKGHLEYITAALERCDFLYVGITQPIHTRLNQVDSADAEHRARPENNPLTYFERQEILTATLKEAGVPPARYAVIPFPIETPSDLLEFLPTSIRIFTTTYDDWNKEKINVLKSVGYEVENLWTRQAKEFSGHDIRARMKSGDDTWADSVPDAAVALLEAYDVATRVRDLAPE